MLRLTRSSSACRTASAMCRVLRQRLPGRVVLAAMVPFNVIAARRGAISSRHLGRYRDRTGRGRHRGAAFGAGADDAPTPRHRRRAMGQAARQSQQRDQRAVRSAAATATRAACHGACCSPTRSPKGSAAVRAEGIRPVSSTPVPAGLTPHLLRLPDAMFGDGAGAGDEDRSRGALVDVGRSAARPAHRDRLSPGRHHRDRRPAADCRSRCRAASLR